MRTDDGFAEQCRSEIDLVSVRTGKRQNLGGFDVRPCTGVELEITVQHCNCICLVLKIGRASVDEVACVVARAIACVRRSKSQIARSHRSIQSLDVLLARNGRGSRGQRECWPRTMLTESTSYSPPIGASSGHLRKDWSATATHCVTGGAKAHEHHRPGAGFGDGRRGVDRDGTAKRTGRAVIAADGQHVRACIEEQVRQVPELGQCRCRTLPLSSYGPPGPVRIALVKSMPLELVSSVRA